MNVTDHHPRAPSRSSLSVISDVAKGFNGGQAMRTSVVAFGSPAGCSYPTSSLLPSLGDLVRPSVVEPGRCGQERLAGRGGATVGKEKDQRACPYLAGPAAEGHQDEMPLAQPLYLVRPRRCRRSGRTTLDPHGGKPHRRAAHPEPFTLAASAPKEALMRS
jgi:hypothetical protein